MSDHDECPRCHFENARCACPKNVPNPLDEHWTKDERRKLAESVESAVRTKQGKDLRVKATVTTVYLLDGSHWNVQGEPMHPKQTRRYVYARRNGSHYIITLGYREDVFLQEDGTFIEYMIGHTIDGGVAI